MISLPTELILHILSYLPLETLSIISLVCHELKDLLESQEGPIYRNAAFLHGLLLKSSPETTFEDLNTLYSERSLAGVTGWKSFCKRRRLIKRSWMGRGSSTLVPHGDDNITQIHRFKVDEMAGYIVSTSTRGLLTVTDLSSGRTLWSLHEDQHYVRPYAHCEYGEGFVIFDRLGGAKEVWRRATDYDASALPRNSRPDDLQMDAYEKACQSSPEEHGHFRPWLLLNMPVSTRAYRFVYPTLLVSGIDQAFLWDIPSGNLIQTIVNLQDSNIMGDTLGEINYVELSSRHVFICGSDMLRVFSRQNGNCVLEIVSDQLTYGDCMLNLLPTSLDKAHPGSAILPYSVRKRRVATSDDDERVYDQFVAVHVSPCGSHMVALLSSSRLIVAHEFERVVRGETTFRELALDIQLGSPMYQSIYLAYENERIAVATGSGVFIVHTNAVRDPDKEPDVQVSRILRMGDLRDLSYISCLQMTDTGLFVNCFPSIEPEIDTERFNLSLSSPGRYHGLPNGDRLVIVPVQHAVPPKSVIYDLNFVSQLV